MKKVANINQQRCDRSPFCPAKRVCPEKAIKIGKGKSIFNIGGKLTVSEELCTGCGLCVRYCAPRAIDMKRAEA